VRNSSDLPDENSTTTDSWLAAVEPDHLADATIRHADAVVGVDRFWN